MQAVVFQPQTQSQFNLLQELARAMSIPFSLLSTAQNETNDKFLAEVAIAGKQAHQILSGEIKGQTLDSLLDELN